MFAVGDKVLYRGRGVLPRHIPLEVRRIVKGFVFVHGHNTRYNVNSFVKPGEDDKNKISLLEELSNKANNKVGTCSYALEFENGFRRFQVADVCHARMTWGYEKKENALKAVALNISGHITKAPDEETRKNMIRMYEYIIFRSPWKDAFLRPVGGKVPDKTGVYINIDMPYSYCVAAAIALRSVSEFPIKRDMFIRMVDLGVSEDVSYIASSCTNRRKESTVFERFDGGHHVLNISQHKMSDIKDFFFNKKINCRDMSYKLSRESSYKIWNVIGDVDWNNPATGFEKIVRHINKSYLDVQELWGTKYTSVPVLSDKTVYMFAMAVMKEMIQ